MFINGKCVFTLDALKYHEELYFRGHVAILFGGGQHPKSKKTKQTKQINTNNISRLPGERGV